MEAEHLFLAHLRSIKDVEMYEHSINSDYNYAPPSSLIQWCWNCNQYEHAHHCYALLDDGVRLVSLPAFPFFSLRVCEQAWRVRAASGPKADAPAAGSFRTRPGEHGAAARRASMRGLRVPAQNSLQLPAVPVRRWRDHPR